jgi:hypothetical protein
MHRPKPDKTTERFNRDVEQWQRALEMQALQQRLRDLEQQRAAQPEFGREPLEVKDAVVAEAKRRLGAREHVTAENLRAWAIQEFGEEKAPAVSTASHWLADVRAGRI